MYESSLEEHQKIGVKKETQLRSVHTQLNVAARIRGTRVLEAACEEGVADIACMRQDEKSRPHLRGR